MPAPRLPWFRFWVGATGHAKVRELSDGEFRTWMEMMDLSGQQKCRGRFPSRKAAIALLRRPSAHLTTLIRVGLVDEDPDDQHLTMHDWDDWQRWRKEDAIDAESDEPLPPEHTPDRHTNGHVNDTRTTHERPHERPRDQRTASTVDKRVKNRDVKTRDEETLDEETIEKTPPGAPTGAPPRGNQRVAQVIDAFRELGVEPILNGRDFSAIKHSNAPPALVAETYDRVARGLYGDDFMRRSLTVRTAIDWVPGYLESCLQAADRMGHGDDEETRLLALGWMMPTEKVSLKC